MTAASVPSSASPPLAGTALLLARIIWLVLVMVQLTSRIYEIPYFLPLAKHPCQHDCLLTIQRAQSLTEAGIPLTGFPVIVLIASVLAMLVSTTVEIILFVRRSQDVMTLLIAALFQPLRNFLQESIDQRFYRTKYDMERAMAMFGPALRSDVVLDRLRSDLVAVIEETMQPEHALPWLRAAPRASIPSVQEVSE